MHRFRLPFRLAFAAGLSLLAPLAQAALGQTRLAPVGDAQPVTVYYPTAAAEQPVKRGRLTLNLAVDGAPQRGNGRLVVISHGSGGTPWVHADLARALVEAGYVVAMPWHHADNGLDPARPGPDSWALRPAELSAAIDGVAADARFAPLLALDRVGVYGMSAGGHTALSMAGGRWSKAAFKRHCEANLEADFAACAGLYLRLDGGPLDGVKKWLLGAALGLKFRDDTMLQHNDPRVAAVVAAVPAAADFDFASLQNPRVPLGLVIARQDRWLAPRFHAGAVLAACKSCDVIADLPDAGHGAMLSPLPPGITGWEGELLNDPPGFDRSQMAAVDRRIAAWFSQRLPAAALPQAADPTSLASVSNSASSPN